MKVNIKSYVFGIFVILIYILNVVLINNYLDIEKNNNITLSNIYYDKEDRNIKLIREHLPISENIIFYEHNKSKELSEEKRKQKQEQERKQSENNKQKNLKNNKVIVIDPGHGGSGNKDMELQSPNSNIMKIKDPGGASGITSGTPEYIVTWNVSIKLKSLLEKSGYKVIFTKNNINDSPGNIERAEVGNKNKADLEIRIHCDSIDVESVNGATMLVPAKVDYVSSVSDISKSYGETILNTLVSEVGMNNRGISERSDLTGFNWSKVPVVLIELGFLSNPSEEQLLINDDYENKLAKGLSDGIIKSLNK